MSAGVASLDAFIRAYPGAVADNLRQLAEAWYELREAEQGAAIAAIPAFFEERRAGGRVSRLSAPAYLRTGYWRTVTAQPRERSA